MRGQGLAGEF